MKKLRIINHPLVKHKLRYLRDRRTSHWEFTRLISEITLFLGAAATEDLSTTEVEVETPLEKTNAQIVENQITAIPILRAGLAMVEPIRQLHPAIKFGFLGLERDEASLEPRQYYLNLPENIYRDNVLVLDPMLATGGSLIFAVNRLKQSGVKSITVVTVISAPEGVKAFFEKHPDVTVITAVLDRELNESGYIMPGLGDAGDRIFGSL